MENRLRGRGAVDSQMDRELHRRQRVSGSPGHQGGVDDIVRPKAAEHRAGPGDPDPLPGTEADIARVRGDQAQVVEIPAHPLKCFQNSRSIHRFILPHRRGGR
jgi:hypothetical protein